MVFARFRIPLDYSTNHVQQSRSSQYDGKRWGANIAAGTLDPQRIKMRLAKRRAPMRS
jgi:hypothetical protein